MTDSTGFDVSTANIFEKKISFDILGDMIDGVKTNLRVDKPGFSLGGLQFVFVTVGRDDEDFPVGDLFAVVSWELSEASEKALLPGGKIETTKCVVESTRNDDGSDGSSSETSVRVATHEEVFAGLAPQGAGAVKFSSNLINHCEINLSMKFHDVFPHRLQFVNAEEATKSMNDCKLILANDENKTVYVNKTILASRSPFFKTLFFGDFKEKDEDVIKLGEVKEEDFLEYLCCVYPSPNRPFAFKRLGALLILADRFQNDLLISSIEKFILENADKTEEKLQALKWAEVYNLPALFRGTLKKMNKEELQSLELTTYASFNKGNLELAFGRVLEVLSRCKQ